MKTVNSLALLVVLSCVPVHGEEKQPDREKAARDFAFEKTTLGTTLASFTERFPQAWRNSKESKEQINLIVVTRSCDSAFYVDYSFLDGKLFSIRASYDHERLERLDGGKVLVEKITDKLGKPTFSGTSYFAEWDFATQNRFIVLYTEDYLLKLKITDTKLCDEYNKRLTKYQRSGTTGIE